MLQPWIVQAMLAQSSRPRIRLHTATRLSRGISQRAKLEANREIGVPGRRGSFSRGKIEQ